MSFSDWQIRVIRDALAAHRVYTPGAARLSLTWLELTAKIEVYCDVTLGKDLLRQFVEGASKKKPGSRRVPEMSTLEAIVAYLTHPDVNALTLEELHNERAPTYQAPLQLLQYLKQDLDTEVLKPPASVNGTYEAHWIMADESPATVTINLDCPGGGALIAITETMIIYRGERPYVFDPVRDKPGTEKSRKRSRGWAILTPEDNLLSFMKEEPYGYNHYYLTFAIDHDFWLQPSIDHMVLLRHDYPLEYEKDDIGPKPADNSYITEYAGSNMLYFYRVN